MFTCDVEFLSAQFDVFILRTEENIVWTYHKLLVVYVSGWVGRWCWVASSAGASYYFGIW